jgi:hypothetical protein
MHAQENGLSGVPLGNEPNKTSISLWPLSLVRRVLLSHAWVAELLSECRSFLHRSSTLLKKRSVALVDLGPHVGRDASGHLVLCSRTRGRILDLRKFQKSRPWESLEGLDIFLAGWTAGAAWSDDNPHSCTPDRDTLACMRPHDLTRRWK